MSRLTLVLKLLVVGVVVAALAVGAVVGGVFITHPRNEAGYLRYVHRYGDYKGQGLPQGAVPDATLVAAGDRACSWLRHRTPALWRGGRSREVNSLYTRYRKGMSDADRALPRAFLPGSFTYLCPALTELMRPHRPWARSD